VLDQWHLLSGKTGAAKLEKPSGQRFDAHKLLQTLLVFHLT
jgi:hypothetical protein